MSTEQSSTLNATAPRFEPNATPAAAQFPSPQEELKTLSTRLQNGLKQYQDFPKPGILFEDIMPLFASHSLHADLIRAFELKIQEAFGNTKIDVIVAPDARGFLFGPVLALRAGAAFVPVRKPGKLPGKVNTVEYTKEYGTDSFALQDDAIAPGAMCIVVDDLMATGGSADAAAQLVRKSGGEMLGFVFLIELVKLNGRTKLDAPVHSIIESQSL